MNLPLQPRAVAESAIRSGLLIPAEKGGEVGESLPVKLTDRAFMPTHCAESNHVFLWEACEAPPFMRAVPGWKIVGYGKAPWPKKDWPLAVMFERTEPPSSEYGNSHGDEMKEGTRIWQHGREYWIPGRPAFLLRVKEESFASPLPTPKPVDGRTARGLRPLKGNYRARYVITPAQLKAQRPDLFPT